MRGWQSVDNVSNYNSMTSHLSFDDVLKRHLGRFGWYQGFVVAAMCMVALPLSFSSLDVRFVHALPDHWCHVQEVMRLQHVHGNVSFLRQLKVVSPPVFNMPLQQQQQQEESHILGYSSCRTYDIDYTGYTSWEQLERSVAERLVNASSSTTQRFCTDWRFDKSQYLSTVVTEWQLVCGRESGLLAASPFVPLLGQALGALVFGFLADVVGRRTVCLACLVLHVLLRLASAFSNSYSLYMLLRFAMALTTAGVLVSMKVLLLELVCGPWRALVGLGDWYMYCLGSLFMGCLAYGIRHWRTLVLALTVPFTPLLLTFFVTPESARWLYTKGYAEYGDRVLQDIAKVNNKTLPYNVRITNKFLSRHETSTKTICHSINMVKKICIICFCWLVSSVVYSGLTKQPPTFTDCIYMDTGLFGVIELSGLVVCTVLVNTRFGRRGTLSLSLLLAGVLVLIMLAVLPTDMQSTHAGLVAVSTVVKFTITIALATLTLVTMETTPTAFRCLGLGLGMTCAQLGGLVVVFLAPLETSRLRAPLIVFGVASMCACLLSLLLPETRTTDLPDTTRDADAMIMRPKKKTVEEPKEYRESLPLRTADSRRIRT